MGFERGGAGLKPSGARDVALVVNDGPNDAAAAVFTGNRVKAAPVLWSQQVIADGRVRSVVLNAGGANACTGPAGFADTHRTAEHVAAVLGSGAGEVAVCSTGLIGERLPMTQLLAGVDAAAAALRDDGGPDAADAIRTTDTVAKQHVFRHVNGWTVGGMAKGAGMLAPSLATMLCVITTDAVADAATLDAALREATRLTFDRLDSRRLHVDQRHRAADDQRRVRHHARTVRPDRRHRRGLRRTWPGSCWPTPRARPRTSPSTSAAPRARPTPSRSAGPSPAATCSSARCSATTRTGAGCWPRSAPRPPPSSPTNWTSPSTACPVCRGGAAGEDRSQVDLTGREVHIVVDLHAGASTATMWTNDLSHAYVEENSAYSS